MGLLAAVWKLYGGALTTAVLAGLLAGIVVAFVKKELRRTGGAAAAPTRIVRIRKAEIVRGVRRPRRRQKPHGAEQKRNIARALKRSAVWVVMSLGGLVVGVAGALLGAASDVLQVGLASIRRGKSSPTHSDASDSNAGAEIASLLEEGSGSSSSSSDEDLPARTPGRPSGATQWRCGENAVSTAESKSGEKASENTDAPPTMNYTGGVGLGAQGGSPLAMVPLDTPGPATELKEPEPEANGPDIESEEESNDAEEQELLKTMGWKPGALNQAEALSSQEIAEWKSAWSDWNAAKRSTIRRIVGLPSTAGLGEVINALVELEGATGGNEG